MSNGPRFQASEKVGHGCCWSASVTDTNSPPRYEGDTGMGMICECESIETAQLIALALNRHFTIENGGAA